MDITSILTSTASTAAGGALGGVFRLVPEGLKFFDRRADRAHELDMFKLQLQADAQKTAEQLQVISAQHEVEADNKELDALVEGVKVQGQQSGVPWVDALNTAVRPVLTMYWGVFLYTAVLWARFWTLHEQGVGAATAIQQLWGPPEYTLVSSMFSFWFVDRALRRGGGVGAAH